MLEYLPSPTSQTIIIIINLRLRGGRWTKKLKRVEEKLIVVKNEEEEETRKHQEK